MVTVFIRMFNDHPRSVGESYFQHLLFALWFASQLTLAAGAALIHALLPFTFQKTASGIIQKLHARTHNRA